MNLVAWLLVALGIFAAGAGVGVVGSNNHFHAILATEHIAQTQALLVEQTKATNALAANDAIKTKLGVEHAKAQADLDYLRAHPAGRVQLPRIPCAAAMHQADTATGSAVPATSAERARDPAQDALGNAQQGMESDAVEWSSALNACRTVMDWAKEQGK